MPGPQVVLASASASRAAILTNAGVPHRIDPAHVDEDAVKQALAAERATPAAVAATLAELKAQQVSMRSPARLVIGADQVLECGGVMFDKPPDRDHARAHLLALRGRAHVLTTAVAVVRDRRLLWHHDDCATLTMRELADDFIDDYLGALGDAACRSVGAYQLEGRGAQLFSRIDGDFFTILGLPLLALLDFLRNHRVVAA